MDFEFYVGGIEDGILALLKAAMAPEVKSFETYSGQLDNPETLKTAIAAKARPYPLVMASYTEGVNVKMPPVAPVFGGSLIFRHDCSFAVMCVSTDARGEGERRRGVLGTYGMIAKVWDTLAGLRLTVMVAGVKQLLTTEPLTPTSIEYIAKMPNMTAYAVMLDTSFKWKSPDRTVEGVDVTQLIVGVGANNLPPDLPAESPGVKTEVGN